MNIKFTLSCIFLMLLSASVFAMVGKPRPFYRFDDEIEVVGIGDHAPVIEKGINDDDGHEPTTKPSK